MASLDKAPDAELEARLALSLRQAPRNLSDAERQLVRQRIARSLNQRQALRAVSLENGDEPAFTFDPIPAERRQVKDERM